LHLLTLTVVLTTLSHYRVRACDRTLHIDTNIDCLGWPWTP